MNVKFRVKSKQDFQKVISKKHKITSNQYIIYYLNNDHLNPRFGISASKKLGCAVERVRIRRQVRAMILELMKHTTFKNLDFVIIVRKSFCENEFQDNLENLKKLFIKIGGITNEKKD